MYLVEREYVETVAILLTEECPRVVRNDIVNLDQMNIGDPVPTQEPACESELSIPSLGVLVFNHTPLLNHQEGARHGGIVRTRGDVLQGEN